MTETAAHTADGQPPPTEVTLAEAARLWAKIGLLSFGGPAGQIALMHRLVEERRWIDEPRFLHALNFCMLLPGPEAQQLATYVGGCCTARAAGGRRHCCSCCRRCFVMLAPRPRLCPVPGHPMARQPVPRAQGGGAGHRRGGLASGSESAALKTRLAVVLAGLAFLGTLLLGVPFPAIVVGAGVLGALVVRRWSGALRRAAAAARPCRRFRSAVGGKRCARS